MDCSSKLPHGDWKHTGYFHWKYRHLRYITKKQSMYAYNHILGNHHLKKKHKPPQESWYKMWKSRKSTTDLDLRSFNVYIKPTNLNRQNKLTLLSIDMLIEVMKHFHMYIMTERFSPISHMKYVSMLEATAALNKRPSHVSI